MTNQAAVLGTGQTHHVTKRTDVSMAGMCREAIDREHQCTPQSNLARKNVVTPFQLAIFCEDSRLLFANAGGRMHADRLRIVRAFARSTFRRVSRVTGDGTLRTGRRTFDAACRRLRQVPLGCG